MGECPNFMGSQRLSSLMECLYIWRVGPYNQTIGSSGDYKTGLLNTWNGPQPSNISLKKVFKISK